MIPYLGRITRLEVESKGAFYIAGVQNSPSAQKVTLENQKKRELEKKKKTNVVDDKNKTSVDKKDDDETTHLDTWA
jgi:hypothetical protein